MTFRILVFTLVALLANAKASGTDCIDVPACPSKGVIKVYWPVLPTVMDCTSEKITDVIPFFKKTYRLLFSTDDFAIYDPKGHILIVGTSKANHEGIYTNVY